MYQVVVEKFGGTEELKLVELPTPEPGPGAVRVRLTSIGMNHADLMARAGQYRLSSGDPPFVPGLEGGGVIDAVGPGVTSRKVGQRVTLGADVPRLQAPKTAPPDANVSLGGTYRTHYVCLAEKAIPAPDAVPDSQLGALWLTYLTAWGCLIWRHRLQPGAWVALPAASSGVALAAAQIARKAGARTIGLTTSPGKVEALRTLETAAFDHLVATREPGGGERKWHQDLRKLTGDHGVDAFFDPVAAGDYLSTEIKCLAQFGTVWVYGLLGRPGTVDVTPLIRKHAAIRGWQNPELLAAGEAALEEGYRYILDGFARGDFRQHVLRTFALAQVREAHEYMERGEHIGKLVLVP